MRYSSKRAAVAMLAPRRTRRGERVEAPIPAFLAGDIILFASTGDLYSKVARWLMRGEHEAPTYAVHTAQFLDPHRVLEMDRVVRIETLDEMLNRRYRQGPLRVFPPLPLPSLHRRGLWKRRGFEVWRCPTLTSEQRGALTREALKYLNVSLGFVKCWAHLLDDLGCKLLHRDVFLFRHIDPEDRHPVCSGITASVYDKALHYRFGVDPECADPDQIRDWVTSHPHEWVRVCSIEEYPQRLSTRPALRRRANNEEPIHKGHTPRTKIKQALHRFMGSAAHCRDRRVLCGR